MIYFRYSPAIVALVHWDIDRYREMQDHAWQLDSLGAEHDRAAPGDGPSSDGDANRTAACELRADAAHMLSKYWDVLWLLDGGRCPQWRTTLTR